MQKTIKILFFVILFAPKIVFGALFINEVMYNPEGSDTGREWVEVCNDSDTQEQLTKYSLADSGKNHRIIMASGTDYVSANKCVILSNNPDKFKLDYPNLDAPIFKVSFTLNNTGELLEIRLDGVPVDKVEYTNDAADGNGLSLHRSGNGFLPGEPSPGVKDFVPKNDSDASANSTSSSQDGTSSNKLSALPLYKFKTVEIEPPQDIYIRFKESVVAHVGEYIDFNFETYDARGKSVDKVSKEVFFGDGKSSKYDFLHFYRFEGEYTVLLKAVKDKLKDEKTVQVNIYDADLKLWTYKDKKVLKILNQSKYKIDLYKWRIFCGTQFKELTHLIVSGNSAVNLFLNDFFYGCDVQNDDIYLKSPAQEYFYAELFSTNQNIVQDGINIQSKKESVSGNMLSADKNNASFANQAEKQEDEKEIKHTDLAKNTVDRNTQTRVRTQGKKIRVSKSLIGTDVGKLQKYQIASDYVTGKSENAHNKTESADKIARLAYGNKQSLIFHPDINLDFLYIFITLLMVGSVILALALKLNFFQLEDVSDKILSNEFDDWDIKIDKT